jgi:phage tail P2-like protein
MWKTINIVPSSIQNDLQVIAACESIDKQLIDIQNEIPSICFWPFVDQQVPPLLDVLAWEMHVDVWQGWSGDLDNATKVTLIEQSIDWHQHKGTKWAVEKMIQTVFTQGYVQEWYQYGGNPYFFRIVVPQQITDQGQINTLVDAVYAVKNERSWLESIVQYKGPSLLQLYTVVQTIGRMVNRNVPVSTNLHS